jgi:hypothetical protein
MMGRRGKGKNSRAQARRYDCAPTVKQMKDGAHHFSVNLVRNGARATASTAGTTPKVAPSRIGA